MKGEIMDDITEIKTSELLNRVLDEMEKFTQELGRLREPEGAMDEIRMEFERYEAEFIRRKKGR